MPDGTVKQVNPFTGNEVWAVPGRAARPHRNGAVAAPKPIEEIDRDAACSFCAKRQFEVTPEKSRWLYTDQGWEEIHGLPANRYLSTPYTFRRVANLFEIVPLEYWKSNYNYRTPQEEVDRLEAYAATPEGLEHLRAVVEYRRRSLANGKEALLPPLDPRTIIAESEPFYGGCHELIVARDHYTRDAKTDADLLSTGRLTPDEHVVYMRATVTALQAILARNRYVRYVSIFQNWLAPAGASYDHLHRQLVGIDEWGASIIRQVKLLKKNPNVFNEYGANLASLYNLVIAENDHALAFVGIGHRFPTIEVFSKSVNDRPWKHTPEEMAAMSDLVHACHAATGAEVSCNEEWYYTPVDAIVKMPWHVLIKWRISVPAGFEGGTSIHINPMTPIELRDRLVPKLYELRDAGLVRNVLIAEECRLTPNALQYYHTS